MKNQKIRNALLFIIIVLIITTPTQAALTKQIYTDTIEYYKAPLSWEKKHWQRFGVITTSVLVAYAFDEKLNDSLISHRSGPQQSFDDFGAVWTEFRLSGPVMVGLVAAGKIYGKPRWQAAGINMIESAALAVLSSQMIKWTVMRCRPNATTENDHWFESGCGRSFLSGHSTFAFSMSTALVKSFPEADWRLKIPVYSIAVAGAFGRLYDNKHWLSDVIAGSALGYYTASFVINRRQKSSQNNTQLWLTPSQIGLLWRW